VLIRIKAMRRLAQEAWSSRRRLRRCATCPLDGDQSPWAAWRL